MAVGTFALTAMGAMAIHFHNMASRFDGYAAGKLFIREEAGFFGAGAIPESRIASLSRLRGVKNVIPILISRLDPGEVLVFGFPKIALGLPVDRIPILLHDVPLARGRWPQSGGECALGADVAGDAARTTFTYLGKVFTVSGVMGRTDGQEDEEMVVPLRSLESLLGRNGMVSYGIVIPDGSVPEQSLARAIVDLDPHLQVLPPEILRRDVRRSELLWDTLTLGTGAIAALVGGIGILTVMMMSVQERIGEIAVARALGADAKQIFSLFLMEASILSFIGSALGFSAGMAFTAAANRFLERDGMILFQPTPALAIFSLALSVALAAAGGLYPAWRGARMEIAAAIRR